MNQCLRVASDTPTTTRPGSLVGGAPVAHGLQPGMYVLLGFWAPGASETQGAALSPHLLLSCRLESVNVF